MERVIILLDADCFEHQIWTRNESAAMKQKPGIITNSSKKIITVNYPARKFGISRNHTVIEAQAKCPDLRKFVIPNRWGKPDQKTPRLASYELYDSILKYRTENDTSITIDYSSKDEFFIDVSNFVTKRMEASKALELPRDFYSKTILEMNDRVLGSQFVQNFWTPYGVTEKRLFIGAVIAGELIRKIKLETEIDSSAGVSMNKLLAKMACGINKPNAVTVLTKEGFLRVSTNLKIEDLPSLGGVRGQEIKTQFQITTIADLQNIPEIDLKEKLGLGEEYGAKLFRLAAGVDDTPVVEKSMKDTISCGKSLFADRILRNIYGLKKIIRDFSEEMCERLEEERERNKRRPLEIKVQITRQRPTLTQEVVPALPADSGTIQLSKDVTVREIVVKSMELLESQWALHGERPLKEINKVQLVARKFTPITEDFDQSE